MAEKERDQARSYLGLVCFLSILLTTVIVVDASAAETWHFKCFDENGNTLVVKAISAEGIIYDVKATKAASLDLLDIKAIHPKGGQKLPVKVVPSGEGEPYSDVKAITKDNKMLPIKAITTTGKTLDVKAFYNSKTDLYDIKCLNSDGKRLGIKAISPAGEVHDVKGIKNLPGQEELGIKIEANIKAMP